MLMMSRRTLSARLAATTLALAAIACDAMPDTQHDEQPEREHPALHAADAQPARRGATAYAPPGNTDDGWFYDLSYRDVLMSPDGQTLLAMVPAPGPGAGFAAPALLLALHDLATGTTHLLPQHRDVRAIAFAADSSRAYLLSDDGLRIAALDLATRATKQTIELGAPHSALEQIDAGKHLVATNRPMTAIERRVITGRRAMSHNTSVCQAIDGRDLCRLTIIRLSDGQLRPWKASGPIFDVDLAPSGQHLAVTWNEIVSTSSDPKHRGGAPTSAGRVSLVSLGPQAAHRAQRSQPHLFSSTRCASALQFGADGAVGILSGVDCPAARVMVFAVKTGKKLLEVSGAGPVALDDAQQTVVFATTAPAQRGADVKGATAIVAIDLKSLSVRSAQWGKGPQLPSLTLSADGTIAYATDHEGLTLSRLRIADMTRKTVIGGVARLDQSAWSADGKHLYVLSKGALYRVPAGTTVATHVDVPGSPELLGLRQKGDLLVLGEATAPMFYLVDVGDGDKVKSLHLFAQ